MSLELIYTSAPRGLKPGSRGFCTVACTQGMNQQMIDRLETLSGYRNLFGPGDANAKLNPVTYSHLVMTVAGRRCHVLSRIGDAGLDYTQRTNKIAHHLVLDSAELPLAGPAWLLAVPGFLRSQWEGDPTWLPQGPILPRGDSALCICHAWQRLTGDAGWGGVLAESASSGSRPVTIIFPPGMEMLPLFVESLALLPKELRWNITFSTYFTTLPAGITCQWRCLADSTPEAATARRESQANMVIDLCRPMPPAGGGVYVEAARTGKMPSLRSAVPSFQPDSIDDGLEYSLDVKDHLMSAHAGKLPSATANIAGSTDSTMNLYNERPPVFKQYQPSPKYRSSLPWVIVIVVLLLLIVTNIAVFVANFGRKTDSQNDLADQHPTTKHVIATKNESAKEPIAANTKRAEEKPIENTESSKELTAANTKPAKETPPKKTESSKELAVANTERAEEKPTENTESVKELAAANAKPAKETPPKKTESSKELAAANTKRAEEKPIENTESSKELTAANTMPAKETPTENTDSSKELAAANAERAEEKPTENTESAKELGAANAKPAKETPTENTETTKEPVEKNTVAESIELGDAIELPVISSLTKGMSYPLDKTPISIRGLQEFFSDGTAHYNKDSKKLTIYKDKKKQSELAIFENKKNELGFRWGKAAKDNISESYLLTNCLLEVSSPERNVHRCIPLRKTKVVVSPQFFSVKGTDDKSLLAEETIEYLTSDKIEGKVHLRLLNPQESWKIKPLNGEHNCTAYDIEIGDMPLFFRLELKSRMERDVSSPKTLYKYWLVTTYKGAGADKIRLWPGYRSVWVSKDHELKVLKEEYQSSQRDKKAGIQKKIDQTSSELEKLKNILSQFDSYLSTNLNKITYCLYITVDGTKIDIVSTEKK